MKNPTLKNGQINSKLPNGLKKGGLSPKEKIELEKVKAEMKFLIRAKAQGARTAYEATQTKMNRGECMDQESLPS